MSFLISHARTGELLGNGGIYMHCELMISSHSSLKIFLNTMDASYIDNTDSKRMVIDYIAGMTDDYFVKKIKEISVNTK